MKPVIIAASTGCSSISAERACIRPLEAALRTSFPEYDVCRAYTSQRILERLKQQGEPADGIDEAVRRYKGHIACIASTHIIPGGEYEKLIAAAGNAPVSAPLLACEEDLRFMSGLLERIAAEENRALLVMGHGSDHAADEVYRRLTKRLSDRVFLACMKGSLTLDSILPLLGPREITLMPLMLAAGGHAARDLAGDHASSWKSILAAAGFDVRVRMQGLGSFEEVQQRFVQKIRNVL